MDIRQFDMANSRVKDLNIEPIQSKYKLYTLDDWISFRQKRGNEDNNLMSTFHPRTLTAHVLQDNPFYMLNLFHEYFGHGSFCEHSKIGQRFVKYESQLSQLENEIFDGQEITERVTLTKEHKLFTPYVALRKESQEYMIQRYGIYEGFAFWFEMYLCDDYLLKHQKKKAIESMHYNLIDFCDKFVKNNSVSDFIEHMFTQI